MKAFVRSDIGRVRPINEDAYCLPGPGENFCAVADGMGGHNAGEVASALAVRSFAQALRSSLRRSGPALRRAVELANATVYRESRRDDACSGMGTTFTALGLFGGNAFIAHVGDSRAYLLRNRSIMQLTTDHTLVEELVRKGLITPREAKVHPKRNIVTRALGTSERVEVDMVQVELLPGDVFLLCTDGLSGHLEEREMLEIAYSDLSWEEKACAAVDAALAYGSTDNITALFALREETP